MARDSHRVIFGYALLENVVFEALTPDAGYFETTGDRRICLVATQPNRDSTVVWRKSSMSGGNGQCIEVAKSGASVLVRDSGDPSGPVLSVTCAQWVRFLRRIRNGEAGKVWPL
jgi:hypothetical protein